MEESLSLLEQLKLEFDLKEVDINTYSPLTLAFIGDCVFDQIIRTLLILEGNRSAESLHKAKSKIVKAQSQAAMAMALADVLDEVEADIYRRGRNAKSYTTAKNASVADYRKATGFEALIGYLYLTGKQTRMIELVKKGMSLAGLEL